MASAAGNKDKEVMEQMAEKVSKPEYLRLKRDQGIYD